jgi:hypothetical protein
VWEGERGRKIGEVESECVRVWGEREEYIEGGYKVCVQECGREREVYKEGM